MKIIESIEEWNIFSIELKKQGYDIWQMQFRAEEPEGLHAWFWKSGHNDIEVVTHNREVHNAIVRYRKANNIKEIED